MTAPKVVMPSQIVMRATASLIGYARNSRTHDERQVDVLCKSITEYGFTNPILIDGDRGVIAGHGRIMAAEKLGLVEVPCIELRHLTNEQKRAYLILDNQSSLMSGWNEALLAQELADLSGVGIEATDLGFDAAEVDRLMEIMGKDFGEKTEGDPDAVPEAPVVATSKLGDVWLLGKHRVMCGDSTDRAQVERLMDGKKADMVFTDPPYGVDYDGGHATEKRREKLKNDDDVNMYDLPIKNAFACSEDDAPLYLWFADRFVGDVLAGVAGGGYMIRNWIIWNKNLAQFGAIGAQYKTKHEPCLYAHKRGRAPNWCGPTNEVTVWSIAREVKNEFHPTQKPTDLCERALANHAATVVLDLFGGSGSTLIACEKTGREARLMELDPAYVDVIVRRWQDFTGQAATLDGDGRTFAEIAEARRA
jgi:DNA modification methylase